MSDDLEPETITQKDPMPLSNSRILVIMGILGLAAAVVAYIFVSPGFSGGILLGTALAFVNYYWLRQTLRILFAKAADGERPKVSAIRYFWRYFVIGLVIAFVYATEILPIAAVILGIAGFGFATVIEGFIRIFTSIFSDKEI